MKNKFFMIDLDGTMYWGQKRLDGAKEFIDYLIDNNIGFIFLTNNSCRTQEMAANHMLKMGFKGIKPEMFYTSAMAASDTIARMYPDKKRASYIGEQGLKEALLDNGFKMSPDEADFLFVGLDRNATYSDYSYALRLLLKGAKLVATNDDRILLSEKGANVGNGCIVKLFEYASGQEALTIGKPNLPIIDGALRYADVSKDQVVILGDNLETDIQMGINAGVETILVTTGVHDMQDCYKMDIHPTYIVANLRGLIEK